MYVNLPVKQDTKKRIDEFRKALGSNSYDETLNELANRNSFLLIADLKGSLAGTPPFKRDKRDRDFS